MDWADAREDIKPLVPPGRVECHALDLTFTASSDVTGSALDAALVRNGQWLAVDGPIDAELGQLVAWDSTGPLRLGYGGWRDVLLGCQFEDGRGRLISVGGRVMKNVAGYDLVKFMVGQRGIFGRVVTLTARTYKRPEEALAVRLGTDVDVSRLLPLPQWVITTRSAVWAGYLGDPGYIDLASQQMGEREKVQLIRHSLADDQAMRARLWAYPQTQDESDVQLKVSIPPAKLRAFAVSSQVMEWIADPWHGVLLTTVRAADVKRVRAEAEAFGGRAEGAGFPVRVSELEAEILRRLKASFDPDGRLAPLELEVR